MPGERALNCEIGTYFSIGTAQPLTIIAGPCQIETLEHCLMIAEFVKELCARHGFNYIFKASYDKANRTSAASKRGPGVQEGLKILRAVKNKLSIPVLSDVHSPNEAEQAG
ncbi:MAG: hypothetical protein DCC75_12665, partial [Proteobacteria bacterium]